MQTTDAARSVRREFKWAVIVLLAFCLGVFAWRYWVFAPPQTPLAESADASQAEAVGEGLPQAEALASPVLQTRSPDKATEAKGLSPSVNSTHPQPASRAGDYSQELVARLLTLISNQVPTSVEQAVEVKTALTELAKLGTAALPGIRDLLARNFDLQFASGEAVQAAGHPTLRLGLLDVLGRVGGSEAIALAAETLKTTPYPVEITKLMSILESAAPGEYRQAAIEAARDALVLANEGELAGQRVAPLFEVYQTYGDQSVIPELQAALQGKWRQNAALALAELPEGIGVPALIQFAQDPATASYGKGDVGLRPLAQISIRYPDAFEALLQQARDNKIAETAWPTIVSALSGNDYISNGQVLQGTRSPTTDLNALTTQRLALLDRLAPVVSSPAASQLLAQQRSILAGRLRR